MTIDKNTVFRTAGNVVPTSEMEDFIQKTPIVSIEASTSQVIPSEVDIVFATGNITITYVAPAEGIKEQTVRNISGTTTIDSEAGTTEITTLTTGQATTMAANITLNQWLEV